LVGRGGRGERGENRGERKERRRMGIVRFYEIGIDYWD
jgi:hypothetical protein